MFYFPPPICTISFSLCPSICRKLAKKVEGGGGGRRGEVEKAFRMICHRDSAAILFLEHFNFVANLVITIKKKREAWKSSYSIMSAERPKNQI